LGTAPPSRRTPSAATRRNRCDADVSKTSSDINASSVSTDRFSAAAAAVAAADAAAAGDAADDDDAAAATPWWSAARWFSAASSSPPIGGTWSCRPPYQSIQNIY